MLEEHGKAVGERGKSGKLMLSLCLVRFLYKIRYPHSRQMTISPGRKTTSDPQSVVEWRKRQRILHALGRAYTRSRDALLEKKETLTAAIVCHAAGSRGVIVTLASSVHFRVNRIYRPFVVSWPH